MSQEQPRRPVEDEQQRGGSQYGDIYLELAAEKAADSAVQSPVGLKLISSDHFSNKETDHLGNKETTEHSERRVVFELGGGQGTSQNSRHIDEKERKINELAKVVGKYSHRGPLSVPTQPIGGTCGQITIGEALEATAITAGQKTVEWSDAAAIQAAEVRATGRTNIVPGGVAAAAQSAATLNARATRDEDKTKLADILADATSKLPADKPATRRDAEGVTGAEMRNDPYLTTHPTGVAASVAAAARLNQVKKGHDQQQKAVKFSDVFPAVQDELADKAVAPKDAATMQTAESDVVGQNLNRGAAATMQSAAAQNQRAGYVGPNDMNIVEDDVTITETDLPGRRIITESVGGQVVGEYIQRTPLAAPSIFQAGDGHITIGEALETTVMTAGKKPVEWSDAAAIQADPALVHYLNYQDDKPATLQDTEGVTDAEMHQTTHPTGVAGSFGGCSG
ncbi:hypothetical protein ACLB2K_061043 [Fragaria x ananassa]